MQRLPAFHTKVAYASHRSKNNPLTWLLAVWELDMVGPLTTAPRGFKFLLVAIAKLTKWIKAKPVTNAEAETEVKFISNIIHHFGVTHNIITDNGSNFTAAVFKEFCRNRRITIDNASVSHP